MQASTSAEPTVQFPLLTYVWLGPSDTNLCHSLGMYLTMIGQQNVNGAALESWQFVMDYELRCQFINYYNVLYLF